MPYSREAVSGGIPRVITPSDTAIVHNCKAIFSNAGGSVTLEFVRGRGFETPVTITLPAGYPLPVAGSFRLRTATVAAVIGFFEPSY